MDLHLFACFITHIRISIVVRGISLVVRGVKFDPSYSRRLRSISMWLPAGKLCATFYYRCTLPTGTPSVLSLIKSLGFLVNII